MSNRRKNVIRNQCNNKCRFLQWVKQYAIFRVTYNLALLKYKEKDNRFGEKIRVHVMKGFVCNTKKLEIYSIMVQCPLSNFFK